MCLRFLEDAESGRIDIEFLGNSGMWIPSSSLVTNGQSTLVFEEEKLSLLLQHFNAE